MRFHRNLFATDFSEASETAFHVATSLARDQGAALIILHVSDWKDYPVGELVNEEPKIPKAEMEKLEALAA